MCNKVTTWIGDKIKVARNDEHLLSLKIETETERKEGGGGDLLSQLVLWTVSRGDAGPRELVCWPEKMPGRQERARWNEAYHLWVLQLQTLRFIGRKLKIPVHILGAFLYLKLHC
jgi:hypothetical protein